MEWLKLFLDLTKEQDTQEQLASLITKHNALVDEFYTTIIKLAVFIFLVGALVAWQEYRIRKLQKRVRVLPAIEALAKSLKESIESKEPKRLDSEALDR